MAKSKGVQVHFVARENGPERLVTEAEIHFDEGPLAGALSASPSPGLPRKRLPSTSPPS